MRDFFLVASAKSQLGAVFQNHEMIFAVYVCLQFLDAVEIDDGRAMDAEKFARVEALFQVLQGLAEQVPDLPSVQQ